MSKPVCIRGNTEENPVGKMDTWETLFENVIKNYCEIINCRTRLERTSS